MQTLNYQCGHCGNLIAVEVDHLNQEVHCPHCLQVVLVQTLTAGAPVAATPDPAPEAVPAPPAAMQDPPASTPPQSDDLSFGLAAPHFEVPPEPPPVVLTTELPPGSGAALPAAETLPELASAASGGELGAFIPPTSEPALSLPGPEQPIAAAPWLNEPAREAPPSPEVPAPPAPEPILPGTRRREPARAAVSVWYLLPLVSYSILATCLVVVLWNRIQTTEEHPLIAFLPDAEGDSPGVVRKPKAVSELRKRKLVGQALPESLKVRLGETRTVGALAVTPQSVTREYVGVAQGSTQPEKLSGPSLVLRLRLENVSEDETFQPLDRYFDRKWREDNSPGAPPLTLLEAGPGRRFFGGPAAWRPRRSSPRNNDAPAEFIYLMSGDKPVENPVDRALGPGESTQAFVCTDGDDPRAGELASYQGGFLWRVQVRRGLVRVRGRDGREHEVAAAAVVGVVFSGKEVGG